MELLALWKTSRNLNSNDQTVPRFGGWIVQHFQRANSKLTKMTYLPPIKTPITEYATIIEMFYVSRELAKQSNMTYVHITLDVGAAIKAFHVVWNNPTSWSDIIIHLGDFHAMMAFFGVIGRFVAGSGLEDILFQAGLCSSGSISGVISGKHYNRCWLIHEAFAEALERLFMERFSPQVPETVYEFAQCHPESSDLSNLLDNTSVKEYISDFQSKMSECFERRIWENSPVLGTLHSTCGPSTHTALRYQY